MILTIVVWLSAFFGDEWRAFNDANREKISAMRNKREKGVDLRSRSS